MVIWSQRLKLALGTSFDEDLSEPDIFSLFMQNDQSLFQASKDQFDHNSALSLVSFINH
jgi:hypothetical protein